MSTRSYRRKRRVEQLQDSTVLRRSPRLSQRHSGSSVSDNPLVTTSFSRSTLDSYRGSETNILNESGQSVPSTFDQDDFFDNPSSVPESLSYVNHDHSYAKGPDISEDEGVNADYIDEDRIYNYKYNKERILTPPKTPETPPVVHAHEAPLYYTILALIVHGLYRIGSVLYLAVTGVLCWDVTFLSWARQDCFKTLKSLGGFWILLAVFSALACILIAPSVDFTSFPAPPQTTSPTSAPPPATPPPATPPPGLSREEVEEIAKGMYVTSFQEVESRWMLLNSSLGELSLLVDHIQGELLSQVTVLRSDTAANHTILMAHLRENEEAVQKLSDAVSSLQRSVKELTSAVHLQENDLLQRIADIREELLTLSLKVSLMNDAMMDKDLLNATVSHLEEEMRAKFEDLSKRIEAIESQVGEGLLDYIKKVVEEMLQEYGIGHLDSIKKLVEEMLQKYGIDHVMMFDFALESAGGQVIDSSPSYDPTHTQPQLFGITLPISMARTVPTAIIMPDVHPGECWCFAGSKGFALIKLAMPAYVTHVTLEHVPKSLSSDGKITPAPRLFSAIGKNSQEETGTLLGNFEYTEDGPVIQTFPVQVKSDTSYTHVEFRVKDNHGHPRHTCVYRVRVHGQPSN